MKESAAALELAQRACTSATGDAVDALVHRERSGFARFADSTVHQPTLVEDESVTIRVVRDGRIGSVGTNRTDEEGLREAARRAEEAADNARPDPGFPGLETPAPLPGVDGWDEETAALAPDELAARAWSAIESVPDLGLYGYYTSGTIGLRSPPPTGSPSRKH